MVGWIILAVIVCIIVILLLIPVGADLRYEDGVIRFSLLVAGMNLQLIPKKKKETAEKPKEEKPEKEAKPKKEKKQKKEGKGKKLELPFNAEEIIDLLKALLLRFGRFCKKFDVDRFVLHWIAAGRDPYLVARTFSVVNAGLSQLAPVCTERFHCRDSSVWTDIDFVREDMFFEFGLSMTIRIGQILGTALSIGFAALRILLRSKRRAKKEEKEEKKALEVWLNEHPEDRLLLQSGEVQQLPMDKTA